MRYSSIAVLAAGLALLPRGAPRSAQVFPQAIERCKRATALLVVGQEARATAFCIGNSLLITVGSSVRELDDGESVRLVLDPGEPSQRVIHGRVVRSDEPLDLALLRADESQAPPGLALGPAVEPVETDRVTVFGHACGEAPAVGKDRYPSVTVNLGRVESVRKSAGKAWAVQLGPSVNPGSVGGPVVNDAGQVVGVASTGRLGAGVTFAIPLSHVRAFLYGPPIGVTAPTLAAPSLAAPMPFTIDLRRLAGKTDGAAVRMFLSARSGDYRKYAAKRVGSGLYAATAPLAPSGSPTEVRYVVTVAIDHSEVARQEGTITAGGTTLDVVGRDARMWGRIGSPSRPIAYEGFAYPDGQRAGLQTGGVGWASQWLDCDASSPAVVSYPGLEFGRLPTTGGCITASAPRGVSLERSFKNPDTRAGRSVYFGALLRALDPIGAGSAGSWFGFGHADLTFGKLRGASEIGVVTQHGYRQARTGIALQQGVTYFLVARMRFTEGNTIIDLYVNPTPAEPLPAKPSATKADVRVERCDEIYVMGDGRCQYDEFRVGYHFADVAPAE